MNRLPPPDKSIILDRMRQVSKRYEELGKMLPDIGKKVEELYGNTEVQWPNIGEGGTDDWGMAGPKPPPKTNEPSFEEQARAIFKKSGITPTATQLQAAIEKLQKRQ
jgi:hypothetical protein